MPGVVRVGLTAGSEEAVRVGLTAGGTSVPGVVRVGLTVVRATRKRLEEAAGRPVVHSTPLVQKRLLGEWRKEGVVVVGCKVRTARGHPGWEEGKEGKEEEQGNQGKQGPTKLRCRGLCS